MNECKNIVEKTMIELETMFLQKEMIEYEKSNIIDKEKEKEFRDRFKSISKRKMNLLSKSEAKKFNKEFKKRTGYYVEEF